MDKTRNPYGIFEKIYIKENLYNKKPEIEYIRPLKYVFLIFKPSPARIEALQDQPT